MPGSVTAIKITYSAKKTGGQGWAGIYWQNPSNNWGQNLGGYDLRGLNEFVFYARGEKGGETVGVMIGGIKNNAKYPDSVNKSFASVRLTDQWEKYSFSLEGLDLSYVNGGLDLNFVASYNPAGAVIYLDEVYYTNNKGAVEP